MNGVFKRFETLVMGAVLVLTACHGNSNQGPPAAPKLNAKAPVEVKRGPTPEEAVRGMVEAVSLDESTVPVTVKFDLTARPTVGQPLEVVVAVIPQIAAVAAALVVSGTDGLRVAPAAGPVEIPAVEPDQVYRQNIHVTPIAAGVQLLGLSVSLKHDEITETRTFSVPLIVAAGAENSDAGPHKAL